MRHDNLKYVGRLQTPWGNIPFWETGKFATPVDMATMLGYQTAVANAPSRDVRRRTEKELKAWVQDYSQRVGVFAAQVPIVTAEDGHILVGAPWYDDERPATAAPGGDAARHAAQGE